MSTRNQSKESDLNSLQIEDDESFVIGEEILIPFCNLDSFEILQNVDLGYFYTKCREVLK